MLLSEPDAQDACRIDYKHYLKIAGGFRRTSIASRWRDGMTTNSSQRSAEIYQFPVGGRKAVVERRAESKPVAELKPPRAATETFGGAWYHDAAIQDSKKVRER